jgi:hypothetical protein
MEQSTSGVIPRTAASPHRGVLVIDMSDVERRNLAAGRLKKHSIPWSAAGGHGLLTFYVHVSDYSRALTLFDSEPALKSGLVRTSP